MPTEPSTAGRPISARPVTRTAARWNRLTRRPRRACRFPDLLALGADRELLGVATGDPHLAAQRHDRRPVDHGLGQLVLGDVVGEAFVVTVVGGLGAFVETRVLQDIGPESRCLLAAHRGIVTPGRHDEPQAGWEGGCGGRAACPGPGVRQLGDQAASTALIRSTKDSSRSRRLTVGGLGGRSARARRHRLGGESLAGQLLDRRPATRQGSAAGQPGGAGEPDPLALAAAPSPAPSRVWARGCTGRRRGVRRAAARRWSARQRRRPLEVHGLAQQGALDVAGERACHFSSSAPTRSISSVKFSVTPGTCIGRIPSRWRSRRRRQRGGSPRDCGRRSSSWLFTFLDGSHTVGTYSEYVADRPDTNTDAMRRDLTHTGVGAALDCAG